MPISCATNMEELVEKKETKIKHAILPYIKTWRKGSFKQETDETAGDLNWRITLAEFIIRVD